jgi:hypothetical protein
VRITDKSQENNVVTKPPDMLTIEEAIMTIDAIG